MKTYHCDIKEQWAYADHDATSLVMLMCQPEMLLFSFSTDKKSY